jgi:hypothetical protein
MQPWWKEAKLRGGCSYRFLGPQRRKSGFTYIAAGYIMRDACLQEGKGPDHCLFRIPWRSRSRLAITLRRRLLFRRLSIIGEAHELEGNNKITEPLPALPTFDHVLKQ